MALALHKSVSNVPEHPVAESEETREGMTWLKTEVADYWAQRENIVALLEYLFRLPIEHWADDAAAARLLAGAVDNDHV